MFVPPWFANALQGKYRSFKSAKNKMRVHCPDPIIRFVSDPNTEWFGEIDTIYLPMILDDAHRVGVVIHLGNWLVEILDPNVGLYCDRKMKNFIAPVVEMLPWIIKKHCHPHASQTQGIRPFIWNRVTDIYENNRSGDCGPLAIKLLEMHCTGSTSDTFMTITDASVDNFRKQYAFDVYEELVAPIYRHLI